MAAKERQRAKGTAANMERTKGTAKGTGQKVIETAAKMKTAAKEQSAPRLSVARARTMYAHTNPLYTQ